MPIAFPVEVPPKAAYVQYESATSTEGYVVADYMKTLPEALQQSENLFGRKRASLSVLHEIGRVCTKPDWDGEGADPVPSKVVQFAKDLILALPSWIPTPDITAEATGTISFDWTVSALDYLNMAITETPKLVYIFSLGDHYESGLRDFTGILPSDLLEKLDSLNLDKHASVGDA